MASLTLLRISLNNSSLSFLISATLSVTSSSISVSSELNMRTPVFSSESPITVTSQDALKSPTVAVITAFPRKTAVTRPFSSTDATCGLEEVHTTFLSSVESNN